MDDDGYPEDEELQQVRDWPYTDFAGMMQFIKDRWRYEDYWNEEETKEGRLYHVSTAGWSGNESFIGAMEENRMFWLLNWQQSRRGGHYIFLIRRRATDGCVCPDPALHLQLAKASGQKHIDPSKCVKHV